MVLKVRWIGLDRCLQALGTEQGRHQSFWHCIKGGCQNYQIVLEDVREMPLLSHQKVIYQVQWKWNAAFCPLLYSLEDCWDQSYKDKDVSNVETFLLLRRHWKCGKYILLCQSFIPTKSSQSTLQSATSFFEQSSDDIVNFVSFPAMSIYILD